MQNNPVRFNDPTGHMVANDDDGGMTTAGYTYVAMWKKLEELREDLENSEELPTYDEDEMVPTTFIPEIDISLLNIHTPAVIQGLTPAEYALFIGADGELDREMLLRYGLISKSAIETAHRLYPGQPDGNNPRNAFQHAYWSALMTQEFGLEFAEAMGNAHEQTANSRGHREQQFMDLYNNAIGRGMAQNNQHTPNHLLVAQIQLAVQKGDLLVLDNQNQIYFSDQLPDAYWTK